MDLKSGYPFWSVKNGLMCAFPPLKSDLSCDVVIVGGGITGALIARSMLQEGLDVIVLEERDVAWGSTSASTALLQYEIDTHMTDLAARFGEHDAALAYRACADAIPTLKSIAADVGDVGFRMKDSLYVASSRFHEAKMRAEHAMRLKHGLPTTWLTKEQVASRFDLDAPCAMLTPVAAQVDPYRLASRLLRQLMKKGIRVFDRTRIESIRTTSRSVSAITDSALTIRAKHVVMAAGYAAQKWIKQRVAANRSSYAFVSDPIDVERLGIWSRTLMWESERPYAYARTTQDHRLMMGGEDDTIDIPARRDGRVEKKANILVKRARSLFPAMGVEPAFAWAGTFAETKDGLPFFGAHSQWGSRVLFAMAYGGNGITYSALGGDLLAATIAKRAHPLKSLFSFERMER